MNYELRIMTIIKALMVLGSVLGYIYLMIMGNFLYSNFYPKKVAESGHYVVRHRLNGIDFGQYCLYEKGFLWDHYCMDLASDQFQYDLKNFEVDEKDSVVSFCLVLNQEWQTEWNRGDSCEEHIVLPIR